MRRRATAQVRNSFPVRCIVAGIHVRTAEIGYLVVLVAGTARRIYQGGEESDAAFFVYFADTVRLQQLVNASAFFVCQVVSGDVLYVVAEVPKAMAEAFRSGNLGIMDYYRMKNIQADTSMRENIAKPETTFGNEPLSK